MHTCTHTLIPDKIKYPALQSWYTSIYFYPYDYEIYFSLD